MVPVSVTACTLYARGRADASCGEMFKERFKEGVENILRRHAHVLGALNCTSYMTDSNHWMVTARFLSNVDLSLGRNIAQEVLDSMPDLVPLERSQAWRVQIYVGDRHFMATQPGF